LELSVAGRDELTKLIHSYRCVYPFDYALLDGDGYVLTVRDETTLNYLEHRNIVTHEVVFTPPNYVSHLSAKSRYGRIGLSFLNAAKVHSGFIGRLALELVNLSNGRQPITIKRGDPFMHIEFVSRDGKPSPYLGDYMFQYMTEDEVALYVDVLRQHFKGLYDEAGVERMTNERGRG
jgi:dCTP deaminase